MAMATTAAPFTALAGDSDFIENWDEYWYEGAIWASRKSKDPRCRVGAVIVSDGVMVSSGFNGLARNVFDDPLVLHDASEKLKWICHAEANSIFNAAREGVTLKGATIYVTKFPCFGCCNAILQAGITRIYTQDERYWNDDPADSDHSRKKSLLHQSKIEVDAPFHPDYAPRKRTIKKLPSAPAKVSPAVDETPETIALASTLTAEPRKRTKAAPAALDDRDRSADADLASGKR